MEAAAGTLAVRCTAVIENVTPVTWLGGGADVEEGCSVVPEGPVCMGAEVNSVDWAPGCDGDVTVATRAGTKAPTLQPSADVRTDRPFVLLAAAGPVVNLPIENTIFDVPAGKSAFEVGHTMVSVAAVNVQAEAIFAVPDAGTRTPAVFGSPLK